MSDAKFVAEAAVAASNGRLKTALTELAVIRYFRPFSGNSVSSKLTSVKLSPRFTAAFTEEEEKLHREARALRDESFAHSDHGSAIFMKMTTVREDDDGGFVPDATPPQVQAMTSTLASGKIDALVRMIDKVRHALRSEIDGLGE